jgi:outer membrane cobalamin receptor
MKKPIVLLICWCVTIMSFGQSTLKGRIVDSKSNEPIIGAAISIKGTTTGAASDLDGNFTFKTNETGDKKAVISLVGYTTKEVDIQIKGEITDLGTIAIDIESVELNEVSVIASVAIDRKTPVAVSTIQRAYIEDKLGNDEFPEILRQTPGIYATKSGGAFGDSRVNIRGFDTRNAAVMINGVPVNDMENGTVYWSNWAGLADVTRSMQVQRGLGAAKIAVPSVGGTINILTNTTDAKRGGNVFVTIGNDNMIKYGVTVSSGLTKNNWATTISLSKNSGNGYVDATQYVAYSYFFNLSKKINDKHSLAFSVFGAPQWHNQRSYQIKFSDYEKYGLKYNDQWGYKDGQVLNVKKNYFNKPQAILNHFWHLSSNTEVITALYASTGTGGGTGTASTITDRTNEGLLDINKVVTKNVAQGSLGSSNIIKSSRNDHVWYGVLSSLRYTKDNLTLSGGIDARSYVGKHFQEVYDLLGGQFYIDKPSMTNGDVNNPNKITYVGDKLGYHNDGKVNWYGLFGQAEYTLGKLNVFAAGSLSDKWYQRVDYMRYFSDDVKVKINSDSTIRNQYISALGNSVYNQAMSGSQKSKVADIIGYSAKGGANYNLSDRMNVFFNAGYFERQPDFNTVFPNNLNIKNKNSKNEKVLSFELGYGFRSQLLNANINVYNTSWKNKTLVTSFTDPNTLVTSFANIEGVNALHRGIEVSLVSSPVNNLKINGLISIGDWRWKNNIDSVHIFDENHNPVGSPVNLKLKNVHVGNSAQTVLGLGVDYDLNSGFGIGANYTYFDRLYAYFDVASHTTAGDVWKMPSYGLLDMNMKYNFTFAGLHSSFYVNVHNVLNTKYFSDGTDADMTAPGAKMNAQIWYGLGTTWSVGIKVKF